MLRISYSNSAGGQHWRLCGRLAGPWVDEFRSFWQHTRDTARQSHAVVDLREVTFIDESAEELLSEMHGAGVEFVAAGVEIKHLLEHLNGRGRGAGTPRNKNKNKGSDQ